jgi:hypothetical protein
MSQFRSILVADDFSEGSRNAFAMNCSLAREDEARLNVMGTHGCTGLCRLLLGSVPEQAL